VSKGLEKSGERWHQVNCDQLPSWSTNNERSVPNEERTTSIGLVAAPASAVEVDCRSLNVSGARCDKFIPPSRSKGLAQRHTLADHRKRHKSHLFFLALGHLAFFLLGTGSLVLVLLAAE